MALSIGFNFDGYSPTYTSSPEELNTEHALVPRLNVRAAAGAGTMVEYEEVESHLAFRRDWLHENGLHARHLKIIEVTGDSMEPLLKSSDVVIVDTSKTLPENGCIVIVQKLDEGLVIKRAEQLEKHWWLMSENSDYRPYRLSAQYRIIGHLVNWKAGKIKD